MKQKERKKKKKRVGNRKQIKQTQKGERETHSLL